MSPISHDSPHPAYIFAFVIQDRFALPWGGVSVVSPPCCGWNIPSQTIKTMLRTPDGKFLESTATLEHTTPGLDNIISLNLSDLTKADVPIGTELFVRMRRTSEEQKEALAALDEMMGSSWTSLEEFPEFPDAQDFRLWIKDQMDLGLAQEVPIKKRHRRDKSGEHWYKNLGTDQVWRYLETILPSRQSFECIENYSQIDKIHITIDPSASFPHAPNSLLIKVWINDRLPFEDDYTLDISSFFAALDVPHGTVSFTGGCGVPECCAVGFRTRAGDDRWQWEDFEFSWSNVYEVANQLINHIELLPGDTWDYDFYNPFLDDFRRIRDAIRSRLSVEPD